MKLNSTQDEATVEEATASPLGYEENTSAESVVDSDRGVIYPRYYSNSRQNNTMISSLYLLRYLCNIIQNQLRFEEKQKAQRTDKKLQQKTNEKKQDQGLKM